MARHPVCAEIGDQVAQTVLGDAGGFPCIREFYRLLKAGGPHGGPARMGHPAFIDTLKGGASARLRWIFRGIQF